MSSIVAQPLTHCPVCHYDLTGLPRNHRCPECGFEYDETTRIWIKDGKSVWILVLAVLNLLSGVTFSIVLLVKPGVGGSMMFTSALRYIFFVTALVYAYKYWNSRSFTVVGPQGLTYKCPFRSICQVPWSELRFSDVFLCLERRTTDGWTFFWPPIVHLPKADQDSLLATIRDVLPRYELERFADGSTL